MEKKSGCHETVTRFFFCIPPVSRFCAGACSWRLFFFFLVYFFPLSVYGSENNVANIIYSLLQFSMYVMCVCSHFLLVSFI